MFVCDKCGEETYSIELQDGGCFCQSCVTKGVKIEIQVDHKGLLPADDFEFHQMMRILNK